MIAVSSRESPACPAAGNSPPGSLVEPSTAKRTSRPARGPEAGRPGTCLPGRRHELRARAVAAQPRVGPVGDLARALRHVFAPRLGAHGPLGLPHDLELSVGLYLA